MTEHSKLTPMQSQLWFGFSLRCRGVRFAKKSGPIMKEQYVYCGGKLLDGIPERKMIANERELSDRWEVFCDLMDDPRQLLECLMGSHHKYSPIVVDETMADNVFGAINNCRDSIHTNIELAKRAVEFFNYAARQGL